MHRSCLLAATALLAAWPLVASAADYLADARKAVAAGDLPAARLQLRNAVKADPASGEAHYLLGTVNLQLGDPAAAEKEAQDAKDNGYPAAPALGLLASAYLQEGRARDLLRDVPADTTTPELAALTLVARGRAQMLLDHPDLAASAFAEAQRAAPASPAPLLGQARLGLQRRDLPAAAQALEAALTLDPASPEALQLQSALLAQKPDQAGAIAAADKAVAAAPGQFAYRLDRAGLLLEFNQNDPAKADVAAVLALSPGNARALYYRAVLLMRAGDFAGANTILDQLSSFVSQFPGAYLIEAVVKQQVGQTEQALDAAARYAARNPSDARGPILLAQLQLAAKHPDQALELLAPLAAAQTTLPQVYELRGAADNLLGRPQDALAEYQKALAISPDNARLLAQAGATELVLHQTEGAASLLNRSVGIAPAQTQTEALLTAALIGAGKPDEAQKAVNRLKAQGGSTELVGMLSGEIQLSRFDLDGARSTFEAVLRDHADSIPARLDLIRVAVLQGRSDDAAKLDAEVLAKDPGREAVVNQAVDTALRANEPADAIAVLERAHAAVPANPRFTVRLASLETANGDPQRALALVTSAGVGKAPGTAAAATDIAMLLVQAQADLALKQPDAAEIALRKALAANPRLTVATLQLSRMKLDAKDPAGARQVVQDALVADPQDQQLLAALVTLDAQGGGVPAATAAATKLAQNPAYQPASLVLPGDVAMAAKQFDAAAAAYAAPLKSNPSPVLATRLAMAQFAGGHPDSAAQGLRNWLAKHPGDLDVEQPLSDLDIAARRLDSAKTLLTDILAKRPADARALNNLAWVDQQAHDPQATVLAQRAYQLAPSPQTADTWGYILATDGGGDHGVGLLSQAVRQAPSDPGIKYHLAVAYQAAGQGDKAAALLTPLVAAPGEFPDKAKAQELLGSLSKKP